RDDHRPTMSTPGKTPRRRARENKPNGGSWLEIPWLLPVRGHERVDGCPTAAGRGARRASWVGPLEHEGGEDSLHPLDFGDLIGVDVRGQPEDGLFFPPTLRAEELIDHGDGALVVLDHEPQELPVELRPPGGVPLR